MLFRSLAKSFSRRAGERLPLKTQLSYDSRTASARDEQDSAFMV